MIMKVHILGLAKWFLSKTFNTRPPPRGLADSLFLKNVKLKDTIVVQKPAVGQEPGESTEETMLTFNEGEQPAAISQSGPGLLAHDLTQPMWFSST